jgi:hypothetical protein
MNPEIQPEATSPVVAVAQADVDFARSTIESQARDIEALSRELAELRARASPPGQSVPPVDPMAAVVAQMAAMQQQMLQMQQMQQMHMASSLEARKDSPRPKSIKAKEPHGYSGARQEDLSLWVMSVNNYLELSGIESDDLRVKAASQFLTADSHAQKWFRDNSHLIPSWEQMQAMLSERFVVTDHHDQACLSLMALAHGEHKMSLQDFNTEFQRHMVTATSKSGWELSDNWQVFLYRIGLKGDKNGLEMKKAIVQGKPSSLKDAMTATVAVDGLL